MSRKKTVKGERCFTAQVSHVPASSDEGDGRVGRDAETPASGQTGRAVPLPMPAALTHEGPGLGPGGGAAGPALPEPGKGVQLPVRHGAPSRPLCSLASGGGSQSVTRKSL